MIRTYAVQIRVALLMAACTFGILHTAPAFARPPAPPPSTTPKPQRFSLLANKPKPATYVNLDGKGGCVSDFTDASDSSKLNAEAKECAQMLMPPHAYLGTSGGFFIGRATGSKGSFWALGPAASITGGLEIPMVRPQLQYVLPTDAEPNVTFVRKQGTTTFLNLILALNPQVVSLAYINSDATNTKVETTLGGYIGFSGGLTAFDRAKATDSYRAMLTVGMVGEYLGNSSIIGNGFLFGLQPTLTLQF